MTSKFKLVTFLGIRPDIIRMHKLIKLLDNDQKKYGYKHIFVHTGQHFDYELDGVFYKELGVRLPDYNFNLGKTLKESGGPTDYVAQTTLLFRKTKEFIDNHKPDAVLFLGDTNSVLASMIVAREGIPVIHIEGGGRSYDWRMPEEKVRIIADHMSDAIYSYLPRYKEILLREGIIDFRVKVVGNIIDDALKIFLPKAKKSKIFQKLGVEKEKYILVTLHREENTSVKKEIEPKIIDLIKLSEKFSVIFPIMPRVEGYLKKFNLLDRLRRSKVITTKPLGFLDFLALEASAKVIVTDSGTVQEEALILGVPSLVARLSTERPETIEAGATILANQNLYQNVLKAAKLKRNWDREVLNPYGTSPSEVIFKDLISKIKKNYFQKSRNYDAIKENHFVRETYGEIKNVRNKK